MRVQVAVVLALVGCYQPEVPAGVRCSQTGDCPHGQSCDRVRGVCGGPPGDAPPDDVAIDTPSDTPGIDAPVLGAWGNVQPLTALNTASIDTDPTISSDGLELFFGSNRPGVGSHDLYRSTRASTSSAFGAPTIVAELSTTAFESAPELTKDDLTLYFRRAADIYRATRPDRASPFGAAVLDIGLSSLELDTNPALSPDQLTASVTRELTVTNRDLFLYRRTSTSASWGPAVLMTELTTPGTDSGAAFTSDPLELYFHSDRTGATDIYRATRPSAADAFAAPALVSELASAVLDSDPSLTLDRRIIVFERASDLMIATR